MDIKWKNNRKKIMITVLVLLVCVMTTMAFFPAINRRGLENLRNMQETLGNDGEKSVDEEFLEKLYRGCYVLYREEAERKSGEPIKGSELFIETYPGKGE